MALGPMELTRWLIATLTGQAADASPPWEDELGQESPLELCSPEDLLECARDRSFTDALPMRSYPVLDLEAKAADVRYPDKVDKRTGKVLRKGAIKRTAYAPVDLRRRRVVVVLHQVGAERPSSNPRWHRITGHRTIKPDGTRCRLHPLRTRLVAANRLDRDPWHAISIEVGGNFEGIDGTGNWWAPDRFGRGRASVQQLEATRQEVMAICEEVAELGASVEAIMPHIVSGRDANGRPNRELCPGSWVWSQVGEWAGAELGLAIPGPTFTAGGMAIPKAWRGPYYASCRRIL